MTFQAFNCFIAEASILLPKERLYDVTIDVSVIVEASKKAELCSLAPLKSRVKFQFFAIWNTYHLILHEATYFLKNAFKPIASWTDKNLLVADPVEMASMVAPKFLTCTK